MSSWPESHNRKRWLSNFATTLVQTLLGGISCNVLPCHSRSWSYEDGPGEKSIVNLFSSFAMSFSFLFFLEPLDCSVILGMFLLFPPLNHLGICSHLNLHFGPFDFNTRVDAASLHLEIRVDMV